MNPVQLRRATSADTEALAAMHVCAWREAYAGMVPDEVLAALDPARRAAMWRRLLSQDVMVQLAEQDGCIVGFGSCGRQPDASLPFAGEIGAIYVLRRAQRSGTGRRLMAAMARDLLAQGMVSASLWVLEANMPARRFYEKLGGREVVRREQQRDGFSAVGIAFGWDDVSRLAR